MKLSKTKSRKFILSALCIIFMCCALLGYTFMSSESADAISGVPDATTVGAIYDFDNYCYDESQLNRLAQVILLSQNVSGASNAKFKDLVDYGTSVGTNGTALNSKDLTVKYGQYRFTESASASYNDLVWMPVYISKSVNGDAILTLYLAGTTNLVAAAMQERSYFTMQGTYSTDFASSSPSNSYGTSWMRGVGVGAGSQYASYNGNSASLTTPAIAQSNKFSNFIKGTDFMGEFYDDIATPSELAWQLNESYAAYSSGFTTMPADYANYIWPNEAYGTPSQGDYYMPGYFNYSSKNQYTDWQYDKVWLPSLTEVGDGNESSDGSNTYSGIWKLNNYQRANEQATWLRTAKTTASRGSNNYSAYTMFAINADGTIGEADVNGICAIRPAIHVNLSKISSGNKTTPALKLPDVITSVYKGNSLGQTLDDVSEDQKLWYTPNASKLHVEFWSDENCTRRVIPIDAATYYMMVTINDSSQGALRFYNADPDHPNRKVVKFVIEKAKLKVKFEYRTDPENNNGSTNQIPYEVNYSDDTVFYTRDEGFIPEIGFYYQGIEGGATKYYDGEYPERIGNYYAYAYIKNESLSNYNYELDTTSNAHRSNSFYVGYRSFDLPEFCYYSDDAVVNATRTQLDLPYKGKNFVQIKNISPNMTVTVTASTAAAQNSIIDLGLNSEGVKIYQVSDVASYTFKVALSDVEKNNGHWYNSNPSADDDADKTLWLNIRQAVVTATFEGLPSSWDSLTDKSFKVNVVGVQDGDELPLTVSYVKSGGITTELFPDENGTYVIREHNVGEYTVIAVIAGSGWDDIPYMMQSPAVQKFTITQASSSFKKEFITWKYTENGRETLIDYGTGDSVNSPIQLEYTGNYFEFSLQMDEARLRDSYLVRATYTSSAYVKDAGVYCVTVTISAYDKNVYFETLKGELYFKINPIYFDMSAVTWDHSDGVSFKYDSSNPTEYEVLLKNLPDGLIVTYSDNKATNTGNYRAVATFTVSDDYTKNYIAPPDPMYLTWSISESGNTTNKKDYDTSFLTLTVTHGGATIAQATWNSEQKKWFKDGKEYVLSFPYDGTDYKLALSGEVTGITSWGTPSNDSFTNAGNYTANFYPSHSSDYVDPEFGTISWTIEKAEIDFSEVRWGYIDENGHEYDVDFDNSPFMFTVKDGVAVQYTVGLIGLPEGLRVTYTTDSLTEANAKGMAGNTFADIGEYETRLNRNIIFDVNGMASNYATTKIPVTISQVQFWKISAREYVPLSYDGSWSVFDNRTHNLIDLCNIPFSQLEYFRVEVLFLDKGNNLDQQYAGYNGVAYYGYHAGNYIVRFYEYRGVEDDGTLTEYFWGSVEIVVEQADLSVTWDEKGAIPVARVNGMNVSGMIQTKYTDTNGMTVNEAYITSRPDVTFYAQAVVTDAYANDLKIVMAGGQPEILEFVYESPNLTANARAIDPNDIAFENAHIEYTGNNITFSLKNWSSFASYLYVEGDSLTQVRAGEYIVYISFYKDADAYWAGTNQDRSTIERHFFVDSPTRFALDYPLIASDIPSYESTSSSMKFISGKPVTIDITNWDVLQDFVTFTITDANGNDYGQWLTYTAVGVYKITFTIPSGSIGYWRQTEGKEDYVFIFEIVSAEEAPLPLPEFEVSSQTATGQPVTFVLDKEELYRTFCDFGGDSLTQSQAGEYKLILTIKSQYSDLKFENGATTYTLTFSLTITDIPGMTVIPAPVVVTPNPMEYTGNEINIITNWTEMSQYVEAGIIGSDGEWHTNDVAYIIWKDIGNYTVYLRIKSEYIGKVVWADGSVADKVINFSIVKANVDTENSGVGSDGKFTGPNGDGNNVNFDEFFDYTYYDKDGVEVSEGDLKDGEDYTVEVTLKPDKEQEFRDTFENADEILQTIQDHGPYSFTYDSGEYDTRILIIIIIAEVAVLVFLIIATIIVLLVQNKTLKEMENEYDYYDDYEEDDEY